MLKRLAFMDGSFLRVKCAFDRVVMQLTLARMHLTFKAIAFFLLFDKMQLQQI